MVRISHLTSPPVRVHTPVTVTGGDKQIDYQSKPPGGVRETSPLLLYRLEACNSVGKVTTHRLPAAPRHVNIPFLHPVRLQRKSTNVLRDGERAAKSPAASIYSPANSPVLSWSLMSSTSVSTSHSQHPSLSFIPSPFIPLGLTCRSERRCMIYEALFLPVTEEKEIEERQGETKRGT